MAHMESILEDQNSKGKSNTSSSSRATARTSEDSLRMERFILSMEKPGVMGEFEDETEMMDAMDAMAIPDFEMNPDIVAAMDVISESLKDTL